MNPDAISTGFSVLAFSVVAVTLAGFGFLFLLLFGATVVRSLAWRRQAGISASRMAEIRDALVNYLTGSDDLKPFKDLSRSDRRLLEEAILQFKGTVAGGALDRLCGLTLTLRMPHEWLEHVRTRDPVRRRAIFHRLAFVSGSEPSRRLVAHAFEPAMRDPDPQVRLAAARGTALVEDERHLREAFDFALSQSLLIRILMAESLRRRALPLCSAPVPEALRSSDANRVLAALQILVAWERAVPFDDLRRLIEHPDKRIRIEVLKLATLVPLVAGNHAAIVHALEDKDIDVSTAAALTAGRLRIAEALPSLARLLRVGSADVARSSAAALAEMPPAGWQILEEFIASDNPITATLARAALTRAQGKAGS